MDKSVFDRFRTLVYQQSGIALSDGKEALVSARVARRMRALGIADYGAYLRRITDDPGGEEVVHLIDAIATNVTSFYREAVHFGYLAETARAQWERGRRRFRFWSTACSTGEEPYTMAMTLLEALDGRPADVRILATDISTRVLDRCREGIYPADKVQSIPTALRERYFLPVRGNGTCAYAAGPALRRLVVFRRLNLSSPPFPLRGPLDGVFCRNVMIYFDRPVRAALLAEIHRLLRPGGFLAVGHAESLTGTMCSLQVVKPSIYIKRE